jgi:hypothetical protein
MAFCKNILIFRNGKSVYMHCRPVPREGRFAIVTDAGRDAVDARSAKDESAFWRTAKACGPDAPVLASSSREAGFSGMTVARKPVTGESAL